MNVGACLVLFVGMCCALQWQWFVSKMATVTATVRSTSR